MTLNTVKSLPKVIETFSNQSNGLPVFDIAEQTVLVQSVYVKWISWGSSYLSATLATGELKILVPKGISTILDSAVFMKKLKLTLIIIS